MVLRIVFLIILIIAFTQLYSGAIWKTQKMRLWPAQIKKLSKNEADAFAWEKSACLKTNRAACKNTLRTIASLCHAQITSAYKRLNSRALRGEKFTGDLEWLYDNYYVVEEEIYRTEKALKTKGLSTLQILSEGEHEGKPRIYALAREFAGVYLDKIGEDSVTEFLLAYTRRAYLKSNEIYLFFDMLRLILAEHIAYLCKHSTADADEKNRWGIGECIRALSALGDIDEDSVFERVSGVVRTLGNDPARVYNKMDTKSRRMYISRLGDICRKAKIDEQTAAERILRLAKQGKGTKMRHVGYYLSGTGEKILLRSFGREAKTKNISGVLYFAFICLFSLAIGIVCAIILKAYGIWASSAFAFFVMLLAASFAQTMAADIFSRIKKPCIMPRLDFEKGVPKEYATFVITTLLLTDKKTLDEAMRNMEDFYLLNSQENIHFALLADLKDGDSKKSGSDICKYAVELVEELRQKYNFSKNKFYFILRCPVYCDGEGKWMGKERKRGAICDFVKMVCEGKAEGFIETTGAERVRGIKYVVTLDADTRLRHDGVAQMAGVMAHPMHTPVVDAEKNIVTEGYAIMQPRIGVDIRGGAKTYYSRIYGAYGGLDPYSGARSDVYQDLFGEAIFVGKGIFDAEIFYRVAINRFPNERILSHDLLEGEHLRCALLSDITLDDLYPQKYLSHISRLHRWIRGDWQLVGWLGAWVKTICGVEKNPLSALSRYKIFDNLRRSVLAYVKLRLIIGALFFDAPYSYIMLLLIFSLSAYPILSGLCNSAKMYFLHRISPRLRSKILSGIKRLVLELGFDTIMLAYESYVAGDAIVRTLWRVIVSKKHLLSWVTAGEAEKVTKTQLGYHYKKMWISPFVGIFMLAAGFFAPAQNYPAFVLFALLWIFAPAIASYASRPVSEKKYKLKEENRTLFTELAQRMWQYFEDFVTIEESFLPPDNVQCDSDMKIAHRTSPTNIALYLSSTLCARDFGFISTEEMVWRIEKTLDSVDRLCKWKNHLFNWYNTKTLEVLEPKYISTVDNGNYIAQLIMLCEGIKDYRRALKENELEKNELGTRMEKLIERISKIIDETSFLPLYNEKRELFSVGYELDCQRLCTSHFDLLMSEARQTSYVAVARGEVSCSHWFALGRSMTMRERHIGLLSWTGTMFEYLMPLLLIESYPNTIFSESYNFLLREQIKYASAFAPVYGISESCYYDFDEENNYAYKAIGVPSLCLKRGLSQERVIAPYASVMSAMLAPNTAAENVKILKSLGAYGRYGLYEALDFTKSRLDKGEEYAVVKCFMVHHIGMSFLALGNLFYDNIMQKRFFADAKMRASSYLLGEKIPLMPDISRASKYEKT